jgi:putative ABC transport system permease protein
VVADVKNAGLDRAPMDQMYSPFAQRTWPSVSLVVRARGGDPMRLLPAVRATLRDVDPDVPPTDVRTGDAAIGDASSQAAFIAALMAVFGSVALLMAAAGLYGVIAYSVAQRAREIAVRMALGAGRRSVIELVVGESMRLCAAGIGAGGACAVAGSRFVNSMLYGITAVDPATYAGVAAVFALVALAASLLPARRALAIDPIVALRES